MALMTVDNEGMRTSKDDGKTWSAAQPVCKGLAGLRKGTEPATFYIQRTPSGALVIVYLDATTYKFSWDAKTNQPKDDCSLEVWAIRSLDGGKPGSTVSDSWKAITQFFRIHPDPRR